MRNVNPTDYFVLSESIIFKAPDESKYVTRDFNNVDVDEHLPIGTTLTCKTNPAQKYNNDLAIWTLIDIRDDWYMFGLANTTNSQGVNIVNGGSKLSGYSFQAFKIKIKSLNKIIGFDKTTGVIVPNSLFFLSNVSVINKDGKFRYKLNPLPSYVVEQIHPNFAALLNSILLDFYIPNKHNVELLTWKRLSAYNASKVIYEFREYDHVSKTSRAIVLSIKDALLRYVPIMKTTGDFFSKVVIPI